MAKMHKEEMRDKMQRVQSMSVSEGLEEGDDLILQKGSDIYLRTDEDFYSSYEPLEELGRGKFGIVQSCRHRLTNDIYAAKFIQSNEDSKRETMDEIEMMNKLHHKRLIRLQDGFETPADLIIIMELVTGGELFEKVVEEDNLTEKQVVRYMRQIFFGLQHMHEKMIVHLDLKPENILCVKGNRPGYEEIKLIDFGTAKQLEPGADVRVACGTPEFVAPEVISFQPICLASDMWSIGVITYVLLSGLSPFMGENDVETLQCVAACEWDFDDGQEIFENVSEEAKDFIRRFLVRDPTARLTVSECFEHPWCKSFEGASEKKLNTKNLKKFIARRRWQKTKHALRAVRRFGSMFQTNRKKVCQNSIVHSDTIQPPSEVEPIGEQHENESKSHSDSLQRQSEVIDHVVEDLEPSEQTTDSTNEMQPDDVRSEQDATEQCGEVPLDDPQKIGLEDCKQLSEEERSSLGISKEMQPDDVKSEQETTEQCEKVPLEDSQKIGLEDCKQLSEEERSSLGISKEMQPDDVKSEQETTEQCEEVPLEDSQRIGLKDCKQLSEDEYNSLGISEEL